MNVVPIARACRSLRLRQFRNFSELELELPPQGAAIIGDNGSGKTNLVEAVYYLEIFRSFRGAPDEQLVRFGETGFHVRGEFAPAAGSAGSLRITAAYQRRGRRKRITLDGTRPERTGDALGRLGAVVFSPSDIALVAGSPADRRRFLDIVLSLNEPEYLAALQRYRQILRRRNAALRDGASAAYLAAWDDGLVACGSAVMATRAAWVDRRAAPFAERFTAISGGESASMRYRPSVPVPGPADGADARPAELAEAFRAGLARLAAQERDRGVTLVGPHRDELSLLVHGDGGTTDLRQYGSGGQQRTAAIALRMVEADTIRDARGLHPLVLLDDLFAELDPGRSARILELLQSEAWGQVILTAPKASDLELRRESLPHWRIAGGRIFT